MANCVNGHALPDRTVSCGVCGGQVPPACRRCRANPADAKPCTTCGLPVLPRHGAATVTDDVPVLQGTIIAPTHGTLPRRQPRTAAPQRPMAAAPPPQPRAIPQRPRPPMTAGRRPADPTVVVSRPWGLLDDDYDTTGVEHHRRRWWAVATVAAAVVVLGGAMVAANLVGKAPGRSPSHTSHQPVVDPPAGGQPGTVGRHRRSGDLQGPGAGGAAVSPNQVGHLPPATSTPTSPSGGTSPPPDGHHHGRGHRSHALVVVAHIPVPPQLR